MYGVHVACIHVCNKYMYNAWYKVYVGVHVVQLTLQKYACHIYFTIDTTMDTDIGDKTTITSSPTVTLQPSNAG